MDDNLILIDYKPTLTDTTSFKSHDICQIQLWLIANICGIAGTLSGLPDR